MCAVCCDVLKLATGLVVLTISAEALVLQGSKHSQQEGPLTISSALHDISRNMEVPPVLRRPVDGRHVFVDIGIDEGEETLAAAASGYIVYSFEPRRAAIDAVAKRLRAGGYPFEKVTVKGESFIRESGNTWPPEVSNNVGPYVFLIHAACGDSMGRVKISLSGPASAISDPELHGKHEHVSQVTLDRAIGHEKIIDLLKSDTQGFETRVMRGGRQIHERTAVVIYELWPKGLVNTMASVTEFFQGLADTGFVACYDLYEERPTAALESLSTYESFLTSEYERTKADRFGFFTDVLCAKNDHIDPSWKAI